MIGAVCLALQILIVTAFQFCYSFIIHIRYSDSFMFPGFDRCFISIARYISNFDRSPTRVAMFFGDV